MWGLKGCDSVNPDHVQILVEGLPKYFMSYLSGMMKGRSSRMPWMEFSNLKEWCENISGLRVVTTALWAMVGTWLKRISWHTIHMSLIGGNSEKTPYTGIGYLSGVYR